MFTDGSTSNARLTCVMPSEPDDTVPEEVWAAVQAAGAECAEARVRRGLSQNKIARLLGLHPTTVGRLERGEVPYPKKLIVLQSYLRTGSYAVEGDPVDSFDTGILNSQQRLRMLRKLEVAVGEPPRESPEAIEKFDLSVLDKRQLLALLQRVATEIAARFADNGGDEPVSPPITAWIDRDVTTDEWGLRQPPA